jgi:hypothetical protein
MDNGNSPSDGDPDLNVAASRPAKEEAASDGGDGGALAVSPVTHRCALGAEGCTDPIHQREVNIPSHLELEPAKGSLIPFLERAAELVKSPSRDLSPIQRTIALREKTAEIEYYTAIGLLFIVGLAILKGFFGRGR